MARPLRIDVAGGWYHVSARGIERREICRTDADREHWVGLLGELAARFRLRVHAWVLMDNHYHLQVETPEANLSAAIQWLNVAHAVWFNRRHRRVGPLFQGRFRAELIDTEGWVAEVNRYIHLNPVRVGSLGLGKRDRQISAAGLTREPPGREVVAERLRRLREYRWSSCRAYLGLAPAPGWLTVDAVRPRFGGRGRSGQIRAYRGALEELVREGREEAPWERAVGGALLGSADFVERMRRLVGKPAREVPGSRALAPRRSYLQWRELMVELLGEPWEQISGRHGDPARDVLFLAARRWGGVSLREIARAEGLDYGSVANALYRIKRRVESDRRASRLWKDLGKCSYQKT
ncbi:MAG: transposase [Verrucomicrobiae bacterium]|nr:transposase [Verrucomicrobiae bacterium]